MREMISDNVNKKALLFLNNGFRYEVKILDCDGKFLKVIDIKKLTTKFFKLTEVQSLEVIGS